MTAADRLAERGDRVRRVVLEEELKREYQRFLQVENRAHCDSGEPPEDLEQAIARWAQDHDLPYDDGHVQLPDARIEYTTVTGAAAAAQGAAQKYTDFNGAVQEAGAGFYQSTRTVVRL